jgi:hypothetical protein
VGSPERSAAWAARTWRPAPRDGSSSIARSISRKAAVALPDCHAVRAARTMALSSRGEALGDNAHSMAARPIHNGHRSFRALVRNVNPMGAILVDGLNSVRPAGPPDRVLRPPSRGRRL